MPCSEDVNVPRDVLHDDAACVNWSNIQTQVNKDGEMMAVVIEQEVGTNQLSDETDEFMDWVFGETSQDELLLSTDDETDSSDSENLNYCSN